MGVDHINYNLSMDMMEMTDELHVTICTKFIGGLTLESGKVTRSGRNRLPEEWAVHIFGEGIRKPFDKCNARDMRRMDRGLAFIMYIGLSATISCQKQQTIDETVRKGVKKFMRIMLNRHARIELAKSDEEIHWTPSEEFYIERKLLRCINMLDDNLPTSMNKVWHDIATRFGLRIVMEQGDGKIWFV